MLSNKITGKAFILFSLCSGLSFTPANAGFRDEFRRARESIKAEARRTAEKAEEVAREVKEEAEKAAKKAEEAAKKAAKKAEEATKKAAKKAEEAAKKTAKVVEKGVTGVAEGALKVAEEVIFVPFEKLVNQLEGKKKTSESFYWNEKIQTHEAIIPVQDGGRIRVFISRAKSRNLVKITQKEHEEKVLIRRFGYSCAHQLLQEIQFAPLCEVAAYPLKDAELFANASFEYSCPEVYGKLSQIPRDLQEVKGHNDDDGHRHCKKDLDGYIKGRYSEHLPHMEESNKSIFKLYSYDAVEDELKEKGRRK